MVSKWPLSDSPSVFLVLRRTDSDLWAPLILSPCVYLFLHFTSVFHPLRHFRPCPVRPHTDLPVHVSVSRTCVKRNLAMRLVLGGGRRTSSSLSWPRCCHCPGPSQANWTKLRSSGWPSATCTCGPLPVKGTHPGALCWRETATAAKVSKKQGITWKEKFLWHRYYKEDDEENLGFMFSTKRNMYNDLNYSKCGCYIEDEANSGAPFLKMELKNNFLCLFDFNIKCSSSVFALRYRICPRLNEF